MGLGLASVWQTSPSLPLGSLPLLTKQFWSNLFSFCSWDFVRGQIPGWGRINKIAWLMVGESAWNAICCRFSVKQILSPPWTVYREVVKTGRRFQALQDGCLALFFCTLF